MNVFATGFVSAQAGSVASANAVILRGLLARGYRIRFFTKPSFVDPRNIDLTSCESDNLHVVDCTNHIGDRLRQRTMAIPILNRLTSWADVSTYNRKLALKMRENSQAGAPCDLNLWMGDYVRGLVPNVPSVGYLQGPPATDARSIWRHRELITRLAGRSFFHKLSVYGKWRMGLGYPNLRRSDHLIVGSKWSKSDLIGGVGCSPEKVHAIPYPIDLNQFRPADRPRPTSGPLRLLWLGRFVPRKRLDLFLDGLEQAIRDGCNVETLVIGKSGFVPNYEQLIREFPFPERIEYRSSVPRDKVPEILSQIDVMVQPSDDENFGSSVAEALACGVPSIVGRTNGTGDYICDRSIILPDDSITAMANAITTMAVNKSDGTLQDRQPSREVAQRHFDPDRVVEKLVKLLARVSVANAQG